MSLYFARLNNILVTPDGVVKVTDFGLALDENDSRLTDQGVAMGSAYYMSPEQVEAKKSLDHRTDIYSLGAVLYELASGRKLFEGNSCFDLMEAHVKKAPTPLLELDPSLPEALNDAIVRALSKKPDDRFATAREFREKLELISKELYLAPPLEQADPFAETDDLPAPSRRRGKDDPLLGWIDRILRSTAVQIAAGVVGLFLIVYLAALAYRPLAPREEITQEESTRPEIIAESETGFGEPTEAADVAFVGPRQPAVTEVAEVRPNRPRPRRRPIVRTRRPPAQDIEQGAGSRTALPLSGVRLDTGRRTEPAPAAGVRATAPPSDQKGRSTRRLVVQSESASPSVDPFRADGLHAPAHRLSVGDAVQGLALSRDGRFAAAAMADNSIQIWEAAGGKKRMTLKGHADRITSIAFSPDGKRLVTSSWDGTAKIWNLRTGREAATFGHRNYVTAATFSPDGEWLATGSSDRSVKVWSLNTSGKSHRYQAHLRTPQAMAFSPTSSLLASVSTAGDVRLWGVDDESARGALNGPELGSNAVVFSPDGKTLAIAGNNELKLFDYPSRRPQNVIEIPGWLHAMTFTDDGRFPVLSALSRPAEIAKLWDVATQETLSTLHHRETVRSIALSADAQRIATAADGGQVSIWDAGPP